MDEYLEKYMATKSKIDEYTKLLESYKKKIRSLLRNEPDLQYHGKEWSARINSMYKSTISKKNTPPDIWEKYSTTTPFDTLIVRKGKQK